MCLCVPAGTKLQFGSKVPAFKQRGEELYLRWFRWCGKPRQELAWNPSKWPFLIKINRFEGFMFCRGMGLQPCLPCGGVRSFPNIQARFAGFCRPGPIRHGLKRSQNELYKSLREKIESVTLGQRFGIQVTRNPLSHCVKATVSTYQHLPEQVCAFTCKDVVQLCGVVVVVG